MSIHKICSTRINPARNRKVVELRNGRCLSLRYFEVELDCLGGLNFNAVSNKMQKIFGNSASVFNFTM